MLKKEDAFMKAVIMAGGNGVRLRPLTCNLPKPMVRLCGRPVMEHILLLLKQHGFDSVIATLGYLPHEIENYFDGGREFGMTLECVTEHEPMGTAGSVKLCREFIGNEDFLVISGDAVCDFDLSKAAKYHSENGADVTVITCRNTSPTKYGLVLCNDRGDIEGFLEKPSWNQVFSDLVNTGIYFIKPSVLDKIPDKTTFDFAKDLFPKLMAEGRRLAVYQAAGYWCDIGDTDAYLQCVFDVLNGDVELNLPAKKVKEGIYAATTLPQDIKIIPPCYIGKDVQINKGAIIGPYAVIDDGSRIEGGSVVERSVIDKATVSANCTLFGTIVSKAALIKEGAGLSEGSVIGEGTVVGEGAVIYEGVRIWPRKSIAGGAHVHFNVVTGGAQSGLSFEGSGALQGEVNVDVTPETMIALGSFLGEKKDCGVAYSGGRAAEMLANAFSSGVQAAGGNVTVIDAKTAAAMSFAGGLYRFSASVFIRQNEEDAEISIFDSNGLLIRKEQRRKMMSAVLRGEIQRAQATQTGYRKEISGLMRVYAASAAVKDLRDFSCIVTDEEWNVPLTEALLLCGASVIEQKQKKLPIFELSKDGLSVFAYDEEGKYIDPCHMNVLSAVCAIKNKYTDKIAAYYDAPNILEAAVDSCGGSVFRCSRDGDEAKSLIKQQIFMRDGLYAALNIAAYMKKNNATLRDTADLLPDFYTVSREINISNNRASMMQALLNECNGMRHELCDGIKLCVDAGWVHISPL
ncbi:MAG: sugar phosphate nucleotidyltransferase, partial [Clostridiales bacterium]|nr:sugar phosphate nucleotidyltransferase [Clostridiales bacterium]